MALFGKKKDSSENDIDDEELDVENELQDRKLTRKFKDLNSENKKKRKEPPKPWGKTERLIVLIVLVLTVLISGGLFLISRDDLQITNYKLQLSNIKFSNIDFSKLNIFKEETIEIKKK